MTKLKAIWNYKNIAIRFKIRLIRFLAMPIFLCACETWTITADVERRIKVLEMRCFRKFLSILYRDHITNEVVKYEDLLTSVKRHKLKWYGHVTRSSELAKTILQDTVQGGRRRGRQRKRWGRQHQRVDWPKMENTTTENREPQGVEEAGCKIFSGAPTVIHATG